jgi:hypothetical protein
MGALLCSLVAEQGEEAHGRAEESEHKSRSILRLELQASPLGASRHLYQLSAALLY